MSIVLKNNALRIEIGEPGELYSGSRFDASGNIIQITFENRHTFLTNELNQPDSLHGFGLLNEFDILNPQGFTTTPLNHYFHKIGVGALQKSDENYDFFKNHQKLPLEYHWTNEGHKLEFETTSKAINGFQYTYKKVITLTDNTLKISYELCNTGSESITTNEYCHNFIGINQHHIDSNYRLQMNGTIEPEKFRKAINTNQLEFDNSTIHFHNQPLDEFFIDSVNGHQKISNWKLEHITDKVGMQEIVDFSCKKMNLWGKKHVLSPELFFETTIKPGKKSKWSRLFTFYNL